MGQEFFINSQELEDKIRSLLPSQGGAGAGFDLSASTQIIPIIDLTESAQGSNVREDLQKSLSFDNVTAFNVSNTTSTIIVNTGYYRIFGVANLNVATSTGAISFILNDGLSDKIIWSSSSLTSANGAETNTSFDFVVYLKAGDSCKLEITNAQSSCTGCTRQIATIDGELV